MVMILGIKACLYFTICIPLKYTKKEYEMFLVVIFISIKSWPQKIYVLLHSIMFTLKWLHVQKDMADLCCFLAGFCVCMKHVLEHLLAWVCVSIFGLIFLAFWWRWHDNNGKSTRLTHHWPEMEDHKTLLGRTEKSPHRCVL